MMTTLKRARLLILIAAVAGAAALGVAYRHNLVNAVRALAPSSQESAGHAMSAGQGMPATGERKVLYWYDPMHPVYKSDKPGIAPDCGMTLVPRYADEETAMEGMASGTVRISAERQQLIGVRTGHVNVEDVSRSVRAVGMVEIDETRVSHVHTRVSGWVRRVLVDYTWQHVMQGDPLFTLYSPELVSAQQEYLLALRAQNYLGSVPYQEVAQGSSSLLRAARERLRLWDVTDEQIAQLEATGQPMEEVTFYAPLSGHVQVRNVFPNQYITPESDLYTLVDHSQVWVQAQLYEYEIEAVRVGQPVTMTVTALPGRSFRGKVIFVDPHLDMTTRSVNVRLEFPNPELALKPGMYATVSLDLPLGRQVLVARDAVIDTGTRQLVFLARGDGYFEPRDIEIGPRLDGRIVVLKGLRGGETVVTSSAFLVDSESRLTAATGQMTH